MKNLILTSLVLVSAVTNSAWGRMSLEEELDSIGPVQQPPQQLGVIYDDLSIYSDFRNESHCTLDQITIDNDDRQTAMLCQIKGHSTGYVLMDSLRTEYRAQYGDCSVRAKYVCF